MKNDQKKLYHASRGSRLRELFDFSVLTIYDGEKKLTLLALLIPKLCETLFAKLIGTVNTLMISGYAENAVGATTSATQIISIATILLNITAVGTTIIVSIELGRDNRENAGRITSTSFLMILITAAAASIFLFFSAKPLLSALNLTDDALEYGTVYLKIRGGLIFIPIIGSFFNTMLICNGKAIHTMVSGIISNTLNVVFIYLLLYAKIIPGISGTASVAVATEFACIFSLIYSLVMFIRSGCPFVFKFDKRFLGRVYLTGFPGSIASLSYNLAMTVTIGFIGAIGTVSLNAYSYVNGIIGYACTMSAVLSACIPVFVGRYAGRGDIESLKKICKIGLFFAVLSNGIISLIILICHRPLLSIFTNNSEIFAMALAIFAIDFVIECFRGVVNVLETALNACRDVITTLIAGLATSWGLIVILSYVFGILLGLGLTGCWIAFAISEISKAIAYLIHFKKERWVKTIK